MPGWWCNALGQPGIFWEEEWGLNRALVQGLGGLRKLSGSLEITAIHLSWHLRDFWYPSDSLPSLGTSLIHCSIFPGLCPLLHLYSPLGPCPLFLFTPWFQFCSCGDQSGLHLDSSWLSLFSRFHQERAISSGELHLLGLVKPYFIQWVVSPRRMFSDPATKPTLKQSPSWWPWAETGSSEQLWS